MRPKLVRSLVAEAFGTFALVFAGCGAIMVDAKTQAFGHIGVALTFGLVIMAMIYAVGHVSGAHFNPAVTFAFALSRHFPWPRAFSARAIPNNEASVSVPARRSGKASSSGTSPARAPGRRGAGAPADLPAAAPKCLWADVAKLLRDAGFTDPNDPCRAGNGKIEGLA